MKAKAALALMAALLLWVFYWCLDRSDVTALSRQEPTARQIRPEKTVPPAAIERMLEEAGQSAHGLPDELFDQPPSSLADVGLPAPLQIGPNGALIVNQRLRGVFDHYLTAIGEEPLTIIVARIHHHLQSVLSTENYVIAVNLLDGYLQYRNNIGIIINNHSAYYDALSFDLSAIAAVKRDIRESRSDFMSADVVDVLFGQEDAYDDYTLNKLRIHVDDSLSQQQKTRALLQLEEWALQTGAIASNMSSVLALSRQKSASLRDAKASDGAIYEARRQLLGDDAADRMAALDTARRKWQQRVDEYRQELTSIEGYPKGEKEHAAEQIKQRHFQGSELIRIRALDKNQ
ncbi:MAG: hypothetical protein HRT77_04025 [Halioglobus sp.]|nr:hypothetical protein [Halioglobus sp.]